jgi:hypothetical protein
VIQKVFIIVVTLWSFKTPFAVIQDSYEYPTYPPEMDILLACMKARHTHGKYRCTAEVKEQYVFREG